MLSRNLGTRKEAACHPPIQLALMHLEYIPTHIYMLQDTSLQTSLLTVYST